LILDVVAPLPITLEGVPIGQWMGPNLLARLMGAMHLTWPNTTWHGICECAIM